ncbi:histidine phosphatase family protein [Cytobacillus sp. IB215665]|uniref:histidine phosphatase family protein n=1 Tax=Cytobacillus sp. IB215665 TaxID=3097357 RepID=UPI002A17E36C|nr:histidine phosphatase family protein [Cytobacillus sp. IB215665]MDX8365623.1 histidine phosphatase family protein [Cytobacillus sp. IB215665]
MEISLIRHGKSKHTDNNVITCTQFKDWVEKYDHIGVFEEKSYPTKTVRTISTAKLVISSDLERSTASVKLLNSNVKTISIPIFRETTLPTPKTALWGMESRPSTWALIFRCLWFSGYVTADCESYRIAKNRAREASALLVDYAQKYTSIVLVGHGFINLLIAKELKSNGWKGNRRPSSKHWGCTTYTLNL